MKIKVVFFTFLLINAAAFAEETINEGEISSTLQSKSSPTKDDTPLKSEKLSDLPLIKGGNSFVPVPPDVKPMQVKILSPDEMCKQNPKSCPKKRP